VPLPGRAVDSFQRRYSRDWHDVLGVGMSGGRFLAVDETEWALLHEVDGRRTVAEVIAAAGLIGCGGGRLRRLTDCGVLDLVRPEAVARRRTFAAASNLPTGSVGLEQLRLSGR
jgi:hypothetical protein